MNDSKNMLMYFILLLTLFVLIFFTKDLYFDYNTNKENLKSQNEKLEKINKEIDELNSNKQDLEKGVSVYLDAKKTKEITKDYLEKYMTNFNENEFVTYVYKLGKNDGVIISKLNLEKGKKDKNGFTRGVVKIGAGFENEGQMTKFLDDLIGENSKYKFYIEKFNYPMGENWIGRKKVDIELILYYK